MAKTANFQKYFPTDTLHQGRVSQAKQTSGSKSGMVEPASEETMLSEAKEKRDIGSAAFQKEESGEGDKRFANAGNNIKSSGKGIKAV